jgi:hypothetical protein
MQDFLKLCLIAPQLLAPWIVLNNSDFMVWLALSGISQVVLLALVEVVVAVALLAVVALGEAIVLLILLVSPHCHHIPQFHCGSRSVASEVVVRVLREKAVLEATDDVLVVNVCDGGSYLEETLGVGPQGLVHLLLDLEQIMMSTCSNHGSLEVVNEGPLEVLPGVDGVWFKAFKPSEGRGLQGYREESALVELDPAETSMAIE